MRSRTDRGFSLFTVLLVIVVLAVTATTAVTLGTQEAGIAQTFTMRKQALAAAEAGLAHFHNRAQPKKIEDGIWLLGNSTGVADTDWLWLPEVPGSSESEVLRPRYRVRGEDPGTLPANSGRVRIEGEVLSGDRVVGRAELSVILATVGGGENPYSGQEDGGADGGSTEGVRHDRPISLIFTEPQG